MEDRFRLGQRVRRNGTDSLGTIISLDAPDDGAVTAASVTLTIAWDENGDESQVAPKTVEPVDDRKAEALSDWLANRNLVVQKCPVSNPYAYRSFDRRLSGSVQGAPVYQILTLEENEQDGTNFVKSYKKKSAIAHEDGEQFVVYHN